MERVTSYCRDCEEYDEAPQEWSLVPFGWCRECWEYVEGHKKSCDMFCPTQLFLKYISDLEYIRGDYVCEMREGK